MGSTLLVMSKTDTDTVVISGAYPAAGKPGRKKLMTQIINCKCDEYYDGEVQDPKGTFQLSPEG